MNDTFDFDSRNAARMIEQALKDAQGFRSTNSCHAAEHEARHARRWLRGGYGPITLDDCVGLLGWDLEAVLDRYDRMLSPECVAALKVKNVGREVEA